MNLLTGVSIIICCHNSARRLPETLAYLIRQTLSDSLRWEVILVDNCSEDDTVQIARAIWPLEFRAKLRIIPESTLGLSHARYRGLAEAQFEYVCFIDDDNWLAENWVQTIFDLMGRYPEVGACGGQCLPVFESQPPEWITQFLNRLAVGTQAEREGYVTQSRGWLWGAGLAIRKSAWQKVQETGWTSLMEDRKGNELTSGGDNEICFMLRMCGWELLYSPTLCLQHFLMSRRLDWTYHLLMAKANGKSAVISTAYQRLLSLEYSITRQNLLCQWLSDLRLRISRFLKFRFKALWLGQQDGNHDFLMALVNASQIKALFQLGPTGYRDLYISLSNFAIQAAQLRENSTQGLL